MTYVEKDRLIGGHDAASAPEPERSGATQFAFAILAWPVRAWRSSRELDELAELSREQLRDIGLTPADVVAARCAPFHVGATIVLAQLAEERSRAARQDSDGKTIDVTPNASARQETSQ